MDIQVAKQTVSREEFLLPFLQSLEYPAKESILIKYLEKECNLKTSKRVLKETIDLLIKKGYDIRRIENKKEPLYFLSRTGEFDRPYFRIAGTIKLPFLLTGDWHVGSYGFSEIAFEKLLTDLDKYNIKTVIHTGDLVQCLRVYSKELKDLALCDTDSQVEATIDYLGEFPSKVSTHIVMGGHEETLKGQRQVGFDVLKYIANATKDFYYYGDRMTLEFKKKYSLLGIHSEGRSSLNTSSKADRMWANLDEKPNILAIGHNHRLYDITKENKLIVETGSLQRETNLVIQKGITSYLGWYIIEDYDDTTVKFIRRTPKVY